MIDQKLINYIQQSFSKGDDAKYIYNYLIRKGHPPKNVSDTINYVQSINRTRKSQQVPKSLEQKIPSQESNKKIWAIIGIFLAIMIIGLFLFGKFSSNTISDDSLLEGTYIELKEDKEFKFEINEEQHKLILDSFGDDYVDITIQSEPIKLRLELNELKEIDLDNDGVYDIQIKLKSIENGVPHIFIKKISEAICTEDWSCTEWTDCVNETQTRTCNDLNNCGTEKDKPEEEQYCEILELENGSSTLEKNESIVFTCSEQNGTICNQTEICNGTIINASDSGKCCIGGCEINLSLENQDECLIDEDCDDEDPSTEDICNGTPKKCLHNTITECITGDDYCPINCDYSTDEDCELTDPIKIECGENIWCYHDKVVETNDYPLCFNINNYWDDVDQGVVGSCIEFIARNTTNCSLCEHIVKQDIHDTCVRDVC